MISAASESGDFMLSLDLIWDEVVSCDSSVDMDSFVLTYCNGDIVMFGDLITGHRFYKTPSMLSTGAALSEFCDYCGEHEARHGVF